MCTGLVFTVNGLKGMQMQRSGIGGGTVAAVGARS